MNNLTELAIKYGADKWGKHHYTPVYEKMFEYQNQVERVLEIGVAEGASLYMWREFFPFAEIFGAEVDFKRVFKEERIEVIECDQSLSKDIENLINKLGTRFSLVIDDGSHKLSDQIFTCLKLMSMLRVGVTYVIEDVKKDTINEIGKALYHYDVKVFEVGDRYDDVMMVVKHKTYE